MASYSYDKVTTETRLHIEQISRLVRSYIAEGKLGHAQQLAYSLWGAFRLWEHITKGDQKDGDALSIEQAIEKLQAEADSPISMNQNSPSPIIQMLAKWAKGGAVGQDALDRMQQFGFVYPDMKGMLRLTPVGKQTLEENGLA
jgi:hypothetical protein